MNYRLDDLTGRDRAVHRQVLSSRDLNIRTDRRKRGSNITKFVRRLGGPTLSKRLKFQAGPSNSKHTLSLDEETTGLDLLSDDWEQIYRHPIYFLETFIDPERFRGTCYRAANWVLMGWATGRGKQSNSYVPNRSIKEVLGYPLTKRLRELLGEAA